MATEFFIAYRHRDSIRGRVLSLLGTRNRSREVKADRLTDVFSDDRRSPGLVGFKRRSLAENLLATLRPHYSTAEIVALDPDDPNACPVCGDTKRTCEHRCQKCDRIVPVGTCSNGHCETCCDHLCEGDES